MAPTRRQTCHPPRDPPGQMALPLAVSRRSVTTSRSEPRTDSLFVNALPRFLGARYPAFALLLAISLGPTTGAASKFGSPRYRPPRLSGTLMFRAGELQKEQASLLQRARNEEDRGFFEEAAALYEQAAQVQQEPAAAEALTRAALLRVGLGQLDEAARDVARYEKLLQGRTVQGLLALRLSFARHHAHHERWGELLGLLRSIEPLLPRGTRAQLLEARRLRLRGWIGRGATRKAEADARALLVLQVPRQQPADEVHEARFFLAQRLFEEAHGSRAPRLRGPLSRPTIEAFSRDRLLPWYRQKKSAAERADRALQEVVSSGGSPRWKTAALARVGALWSQVSRDLEEVPRVPPSLPPGTYLDPIEDPPNEVFKLRAKHAFEACLEQARLGSWYDESVAACEDGLVQIAPQEHRSAEGYRLPPVLSSGPLVPR